MAEYGGLSIVRSYRKRYGVDWLCAVKELTLLGVELDPEYVARLQRTVQEQAKKNQERRLEPKKAATSEDWSERYPFSEGDFYFVAGHTSNGAPYGITWEEARKQGLIEADEPDSLPETTEWDICKW